MAASLRNRLPLILCVLAFLSLATALFIRPQPLPPGVAKFPSAAVADPARPPAPGRTYALDTISTGGKATLIEPGQLPIPVRRGATIRITGWALDSHTMRPAMQILAGLDRATAKPIGTYGLNRPDVAAVLHDDAAVTSGFQVDIPLSNLPPGRHAVRFATVDDVGHIVELPTNVPLDVR